MSDANAFLLSELEPIFEFGGDNDEPLSAKAFQALEPDETVLLPGSTEYRKARKRRQNRESAARSRSRRRGQAQVLEKDLKRANDIINKLCIENTGLKAENSALKGEIKKLKERASKKTSLGAHVKSQWIAVSLAVTLLCIFSIVGEADRDSKPKIETIRPKMFTDNSSPGNYYDPDMDEYEYAGFRFYCVISIGIFSFMVLFKSLQNWF